MRASFETKFSNIPVGARFTIGLKGLPWHKTSNRTAEILRPFVDHQTKFSFSGRDKVWRF